MTTLKQKPGIHQNFEFKHYSADEVKILEKLKNEFFLSYSGKKIDLISSSYPFFLMIPAHNYTETFNISREIISVFCPYNTFQPRALDAFDVAQKRLSDLRAESVCRILISMDPCVEEKIEALLKTDPEQPIVIPFSYDELLSQYDDFFIRNRFRKHFYSRDLFSFLSPLKKDLYFFGRNELIQQTINRHKSGEHTGLFGLRKSGKTSIIYAIERSMTSRNEKFISVDCESPSIHMLRWNELLKKIARTYKEQFCGCVKDLLHDSYSESTAADSFAKDMLCSHKEHVNEPCLLIFDEIERISPGTASSEHWRSGNDFIYFWQAMRGFYQRNPEVITYMLVGTNPNCVEMSIINGHENPIFGSIPSQYVPSFNTNQVRQMVSKLGRYMGLQFEDSIYHRLTEDFGGHPFLIRQMCSNINSASSNSRPVNVDKALYNKVYKEFSEKQATYLEMILEVLRTYFKDEYDMLTFLALDDNETFNKFAIDNKAFTRHLVGYGVLNQSENGHSFNIECIKEHLQLIHTYQKINMTDSEKRSEISTRRNNLEIELRCLIRKSLILKYGKKIAYEKVVASLDEKRRDKIKAKDLDTLLGKDSSELYFSELKNIIGREWDTFYNIFEDSKEKTMVAMDEINMTGRPDAHAKTMTDDEFNQLRIYFKKFEGVILQWK